MCRDNWYNYGTNFENEMRSADLTDSDIYKIKIWSSDDPKEHPICRWWTIPSERHAIENDCNDDQTPGSSSRDMGDQRSILINEKT
jgi:alpha-amylase